MSDFSDDTGPTLGQRDFIRGEVLKLIENNKELLGAAYAEAERAGRVTRNKNQHDMDAAKYGERLIDDGLRKGWL